MSDAVRSSMMARPRSKSRRCSGLSSVSARRLPRLPAIDLIGASELLSSCPSTRINRCHALRSSSRSARLTSDKTTRVCGTPFSRNLLCRTNQRALELLAGNATSASLAAPRQSASPISSAVRPSRRTAACWSSFSPAGFTSRSTRSGSNANNGASISSTTRRSSAVASIARIR